MKNKFCTQCGDEVKPNDKFCVTCGSKIEQELEIEEQKPKAFKTESLVEENQKNKVINQDSISKVKQIFGNTSFAAATAGEMFFTQAIPSMNNVTSNLGPIKYLLNGIKNILKGPKNILKDKKMLISTIVMAIIWILLAILPTFGAYSKPIRYLSFLTFARGGMGQDLINIIGGTIGKGLYAYFITSLFLPILSGKKPLKGIGGGIKTIFKTFAVKDINQLVPLFLGSGVALIIYNFLTGNALLINSMAGIVGFILALRALSRKTGFLRGFIMSVVNKFSKNKFTDTYFVDSTISGITTGFALSILLSAIPFRYICYIIGIVFVIVSIILKLVSRNKNKKEVPTH